MSIVFMFSYVYIIVGNYVVLLEMAILDGCISWME